MANSKELVKQEGSEPLAITKIDPADLVAIIQGNLGVSGASVFDMDRVTCPTGGTTQWTVPDMEEEDGVAYVKEMIGIVLAFRDPRSYWIKTFDGSGGGIPPDCSSPDGKFGIGTPGGDCQKCHLAQFGSAKKGDKQGRGQACRQTRVLMFLRETDVLPITITVPPTSLKECRKFFMRLAGKGKPANAAVIGIKLVKDKSADGIDYSLYQFRVVRYLTQEEREIIGHYSHPIAQTFEALGTKAVDHSAYAE